MHEKVLNICKKTLSRYRIAGIEHEIVHNLWLKYHLEYYNIVQKCPKSIRHVSM